MVLINNRIAGFFSSKDSIIFTIKNMPKYETTRKPHMQIENLVIFNHNYTHI